MDIVTRPQWGAAAEPTRPKMRLPAGALWLHHSVTGVTDDPRRDMRAIQKIGIQRFGYISYSYAVHPDGTVLEGQGLKVGAHTAGRNSTSFGVVLIGDYTHRVVTPAQLNAVRQLIADLIASGALHRGTYPTGGHRDVSSTACPGDWAYRLLPEFRQPWITSDPPAVKVAPMYQPPLGPFAAAWLDENGRVISAVTPSGEVFWGRWWGNVRGKSYWGNRVAALIGARPDGQPGYRITATSGEPYDLPDGYDQL